MTCRWVVSVISTVPLLAVTIAGTRFVAGGSIACVALFGMTLEPVAELRGDWQFIFETTEKALTHDNSLKPCK